MTTISSDQERLEYPASPAGTAAGYALAAESYLDDAAEGMAREDATARDLAVSQAAALVGIGYALIGIGKQPGAAGEDTLSLAESLSLTASPAAPLRKCDAVACAIASAVLTAGILACAAAAALARRLWRAVAGRVLAGRRSGRPEEANGPRAAAEVTTCRHCQSEIAAVGEPQGYAVLCWADDSGDSGCRCAPLGQHEPPDLADAGAVAGGEW